jgi:hypothetical protein
VMEKILTLYSWYPGMAPAHETGNGFHRESFCQYSVSPVS